VGLREADVPVDRLAVQPLGLGDAPGPLGEGAGQVAAGEVQPQAAREERAGVVLVLEQRVLALARGGEDDDDVARDALQEHE